jgi:hypothetical protein
MVTCPLVFLKAGNRTTGKKDPQAIAMGFLVQFQRYFLSR